LSIKLVTSYIKIEAQIDSNIVLETENAQHLIKPRNTLKKRRVWIRWSLQHNRQSLQIDWAESTCFRRDWL